MGRDQLGDYARRAGIPVEEAERWLAPNLADEVVAEVPVEVRVEVAAEGPA
jgi:hypothetical protein